MVPRSFLGANIKFSNKNFREEICDQKQNEDLKMKTNSNHITSTTNIKSNSSENAISDPLQTLTISNKNDLNLNSITTNNSTTSFEGLETAMTTAEFVTSGRSNFLRQNPLRNEDKNLSSSKSLSRSNFSSLLSLSPPMKTTDISKPTDHIQTSTSSPLNSNVQAFETKKSIEPYSDIDETTILKNCRSRVIQFRQPEKLHLILHKNKKDGTVVVKKVLENSVLSDKISCGEMITHYNKIPLKNTKMTDVYEIIKSQRIGALVMIMVLTPSDEDSAKKKFIIYDTSKSIEEPNNFETTKLEATSDLLYTSPSPIKTSEVAPMKPTLKTKRLIKRGFPPMEAHRTINIPRGTQSLGIAICASRDIGGILIAAVCKTSRLNGLIDAGDVITHFNSKSLYGKSGFEFMHMFNSHKTVRKISVRRLFSYPAYLSHETLFESNDQTNTNQIPLSMLKFGERKEILVKSGIREFECQYIPQYGMVVTDVDVHTMIETGIEKGDLIEKFDNHVFKDSFLENNNWKKVLLSTMMSDRRIMIRKNKSGFQLHNTERSPLSSNLLDACSSIVSVQAIDECELSKEEVERLPVSFAYILNNQESEERANKENLRFQNMVNSGNRQP